MSRSRGRPAKIVTKPCEFCGKDVTRTGKEAASRKYWTCDASCAHQLSYQRGRVAPALGRKKARGSRVTRPCTRCAKPITRFLTAENGGDWTCLQDCGASGDSLKAHSKGGDVAVCVICGRDFARTPREVRIGRKHCTRVCADEGKRVASAHVRCVYCGKEKELQPSKAKTFRYCDMTCRSLGNIVRPLDRTYNGKPARLLSDGYVSIWQPSHPHANKGWVLEHRWLMEQHLGRILATEEEVDHKNRIRSDNRLTNLQVLSVVEHRRKTGEDRRIVQREMQQRIFDLEAENARLRAQSGVPVPS